MNLGELLTQEARSLESEFDGATESAATYRAIGRRRLIRQGATAGVAVVGIGVIAAGGVRVAQWEPTDPLAPVVSAAPNVVQAELLNPDVDPRFSPYAYVPACGEPAPAVVTEAGGIELKMLINDETRLSSEPGQQAGISRAFVENHREEPLLASVSDLALVWVQDGEVVAYSESPYAVPDQGLLDMGVFEANAPKNRYGALSVQTYYCNSPLEGPWRTVDEGTYEVYPMVRVVGSYTDSVTGDGVRVDTALTGEPRTVHVESPWEAYPGGLETVSSPEPLDLTCGSEVSRDDYGYQSYSTNGTLHVFRDLGEEVPKIPSSLNYLNNSLTSATSVTVPESFRVWLLDTSNGNVWAVVGTATIQAPAGGVMSLNRWGELGSIDTWVTELSYCGEPVADIALYGKVQVVVDDAAGTRTVTLPVR